MVRSSVVLPAPLAPTRPMRDAAPRLQPLDADDGLARIAS